MNERIENWILALTRNYYETQANMLRDMKIGDGVVERMNPSRIHYAILDGKKFYKIVSFTVYDGVNDNFQEFLDRLTTNRFVTPSDLVNKHCTVHAFVDKVTGDVYKPATWRAPAKHVRFNLLNDESYNNMITTCDWCGSYLYIQ